MCLVVKIIEISINASNSICFRYTTPSSHPVTFTTVRVYTIAECATDLITASRLPRSCGRLYCHSDLPQCGPPDLISWSFRAVSAASAALIGRMHPAATTLEIGCKAPLSGKISGVSILCGLFLLDRVSSWSLISGLFFGSSPSFLISFPPLH